jgi:hypothetical protein
VAAQGCSRAGPPEARTRIALFRQSLFGRSHGRCFCDPLRCLLLSLRADAMKRRSRAGGKPAKARPRNALTVKGRKASKAVTRRGSPPGAHAEVARLTRKLKEAQEQQAATADLLKVISQSGYPPALLCGRDWRPPLPSERRQSLGSRIVKVEPRPGSHPRSRLLRSSCISS